MKRITLLLLALAFVAIAGWLASCSSLQTERDVERMYGPPVRVDTIASKYGNFHRALYDVGGSLDEFGFRDSIIIWHWTARQDF